MKKLFASLSAAALLFGMAGASLAQSTPHSKAPTLIAQGNKMHKMGDHKGGAKKGSAKKGGKKMHGKMMHGKKMGGKKMGGKMHGKMGKMGKMHDKKGGKM